MKHIKMILLTEYQKYTNLQSKSRSFSPYKNINGSHTQQAQNTCACQLVISAFPSILHTNLNFSSCSSGHNLPQWKLKVVKTVLNVCFRFFNCYILKSHTKGLCGHSIACQLKVEALELNYLNLNLCLATYQLHELSQVT